MTTHDRPTANEPENISVLRDLVKRLMHMTLLWLGLGALVGACMAFPQGGTINIVAGVIAGIIVLPPVGVILGLLGGRWKESLAGGLVGFVISSAVALSGASNVATVVPFGLLFGGILGATLLMLFWRLPQRLATLRHSLAS